MTFKSRSPFSGRLLNSICLFSEFTLATSLSFSGMSLIGIGGSECRSRKYSERFSRIGDECRDMNWSRQV